MSASYFKVYSESHEGRMGECVYEVVDGLVVKQLNIFDCDMFWADANLIHNHSDYEFTDQPEWDFENGKQEEISESDFLALWVKAKEYVY